MRIALKGALVYWLMSLDVMVEQKGPDHETLRLFLRIPIEMVQTLQIQSIHAVLGAFIGCLKRIIFPEIQSTAGI